MQLPSVDAPHALVASVDHLASSAGVAVLRAGGSAADAAIATNAVLAVTAPHLCGMGGDLFALVHRPGGTRPDALDAAGWAGSGADADRLRAEGHRVMPFKGDIRSAPVPGCVDGWLALHERHGRLDLADVLAPAIGYARDGFPCSPLLAVMVGMLGDAVGADELRGPIGRRATGERIVRPGVAAALAAIVDRGRDGFYGGAFGDGLVAMGGGELTDDDLARPIASWVEPLHRSLWGHDVWTMPPTSQGYLTLLGAAIAEGLDLGTDPTDPRWVHGLIESARAAAHDRLSVLHDGAPVADLLEPQEVDARRALIDPDRRARFGSPGAAGDTTYLCVVDEDGMGVSLIQSNASGFGTHLFEPNTGIGLHNRGIGFSLEPGHPAEYGPGRRPTHTLCPALVTRPGGDLRAVVGTMGGDSQPQILLQVLARLLALGQPAGACIGEPRWALAQRDGTGFDTWTDPDAQLVNVEQTAPTTWTPGLEARGHAVQPVEGVFGTLGHAQLIEVLPNGVRSGAADPRALIGAAQGW